MRIPGSEITPRSVYLDRRAWLRGAAALGASGLAAAVFRKVLVPPPPSRPGAVARPELARPTDELGDPASRFEDITGYNNYYEFSTDKYVVAGAAAAWRPPAPWTVEVGGAVHRPGTYGLEDLLRVSPPEERVYRMRCVEGWSMVIPWLGMPLGPLVRHFDPTGAAKFVELTTIHDPAGMPNQRTGILDWPYLEGLRLDEAVHPLTLLAVGLYGEDLLNQNGAPLRLVVPWKYGFKGAKSIARIRFVAEPPRTTWMRSSPDEYGFYSNVNPEVAHPRWSQARERRIGETDKRPTLPFNGYAEQVAHLYAGMDLREHF